MLEVYGALIRAAPRPSPAVGNSRQRPRHRPRHRGPVAAARRRRRGLRDRDRLSDARAPGAVPQPGARAGGLSPGPARVPQRLLHAEGGADSRPERSEGPRFWCSRRCAPRRRSPSPGPSWSVPACLSFPATRPGPGPTTCATCWRATRSTRRSGCCTGRGDAGAFNEGDWAEAARAGPLAAPDLPRDRSPPPGAAFLPHATSTPKSRARVEATLLGLEEDDAGRAALARAAGVTRLERLTAEDRRALEAWKPVSPARPLALMRLRSIGTRYALWLAGLALALVAIALVAAGTIAFHQSRVIQGEIQRRGERGEPRRRGGGAARDGQLPRVPPLQRPLPARRRAPQREHRGDPLLAAGRLVPRARRRGSHPDRRHPVERALRRRRSPEALAPGRGRRRAADPAGATGRSSASRSPPAA